MAIRVLQGAGVGSTEDTRWDNSVKYIFTYGPFHAAGMYTNGGQDTPMNGDGYGANAGITYMGFSVDGFYTKENGAVNLSRVPLAANGVSAFTALFAGRSHGPNRLQRSLGNCPNALLGTITDNEAWDVMAKYSFNVPGFFSEPAVSMKDAPCGGLKDAPCAPPTAKVTFYGGYQHVDQSNPRTLNGSTAGTIRSAAISISPRVSELSAATESVRLPGRARATRMVLGGLLAPGTSSARTPS